MTRPLNRVLAWPPAVTVSLVLHILAAMILVKTITPQPITPPEAVKPRFSVSSLSVPSQRARETAAEVETAAAAGAAGERLGVQSIPSGRARPVDPETAVAPAVRPDGDAVTQAALDDAHIQTASAAGANVAAASPTSQTVAGAQLAAETVSTARPDSTALAATVRNAPLFGDTRAASVPIGAVIRTPAIIAATGPPALRVTTSVPPAGRLGAATSPAEPITGTRPAGIGITPVVTEADTAAAIRPEHAALASAAREPRRLAAATPAAAALSVSRSQGAVVQAIAAVGAALEPASAAAATVVASAGSELRVQTDDLATTQLAAAELGGDAVRSNTPVGDIVEPTIAVANAVTATRAETDEIAAAGDLGESINPTVVLGAEVAVASSQATVVLAVDEPQTPIETSELLGTQMAAARAPTEAIRLATLRSQNLAETSAAGEDVNAAQPDAGPVDDVVPASLVAGEIPADTIAASVYSQLAVNAALKTEARQAWTGDIDTALDTQSLAAIQSFMRPATTAESEVRDSISSALARFPCSRLQAAFVPETGGLEVRGHVPIAELRSLVVGLLEQSVGASIPVGTSLMVLPQPQCEVLDAVEALGIPQSSEQQNDPLVVGEAAQVEILQYEDGMRVSFRLKAAEYESYTYLDFYDREGNVLHILPSEHIRQNRQPANARFTVGQGGEDDIEMIAAPPFGQDIVVFLAATRPLYQGLRPPVEDAVEYLTWLQARIHDMRQEDTSFRGEWAYLFLMTGPQGSFSQP